jgi:hypothetical protein
LIGACGLLIYVRLDSIPTIRNLKLLLRLLVIQRNQFTLHKNHAMKRLSFFCLAVILFISATAQQKDKELEARLNDYIAQTKNLNFDKLMEYVHPNLFKVIPKDQMREAMRGVFENEVLKISIDSFSILQMSPAYTYQSSIYRKIDYFISMNLRLNDSSILKDTSQRYPFIAQMKDGFPGANINYVESGNYLNIDTRKIMLGIKDPNSKWMFLGFEDKQRDMMEKLIPKEVLAYFKL